eukprot:TRINITY_DN2606_c0_g1_i2.p1 TRINITY_DN2606_c0_g1~~TRINITY_DN2606_c0_g1_i2.p1  ORF type:complete len:135 (+),score=38.65 TRINITY_DN2606_c0_g1_i2:165-569(+)
MADPKDSKKEENAPENEIRIGRLKRPETYVKIAETLFINHEELVLCGLGNTIQTVVSCAEIIKSRKYATTTKIETSMIEGESKTQAIAKIQIRMKRNPGIKELLEKIAEENKNETDIEKHLREQDEKQRESEQD